MGVVSGAAGATKDKGEALLGCAVITAAAALVVGDRRVGRITCVGRTGEAMGGKLSRIRMGLSHLAPGKVVEEGVDDVEVLAHTVCCALTRAHSSEESTTLGDTGTEVDISTSSLGTTELALLAPYRRVVAVTAVALGWWVSTGRCSEGGGGSHNDEGGGDVGEGGCACRASVVALLSSELSESMSLFRLEYSSTKRAMSRSSLVISD